MNLLDSRETVDVNHYTVCFLLGISGIVHSTLVHVQLNKTRQLEGRHLLFGEYLRG